MTELPRPTARIHIESRECSPQLLERLTGATYFPERLLGPAIVNTVCRSGGHLLYVTAPDMVDADRQVHYYLSLLSDGPHQDRANQMRQARSLVRIVTLDDASSRWLSSKVLDLDSTQAAAVRDALREFTETHQRMGADVRLSYFEPSLSLEQLARDLGVPGNQASAARIPLATKHAGRQIFTAAGIPVPAGSGVCRDTTELAAEVAELARAGHRKLVLKLNSTAYGGGLGNALLELDDGITSAPDGNAEQRVSAALPHASLMDPKITWDDYVTLIKDSGVIAEEMITDVPLLSPSFQGRLADGGSVEVVSTHDQVLGGNGQSYTGCAFPAHTDYRQTVIDYGVRVGEVLLDRGVDSGDYGVDFLAVRSGSGWRLLGCEVNLRATATKHPFTMATGLLGVKPTSDGRLTVHGTEYFYEASDSIMDERYKGLRPAQLIQAVTGSPIGYNPARGTGVVLHMMSPVTEYGKFGALCIGRSRTHAAGLMRELRDLADGLTRSCPADHVTVA